MKNHGLASFTSILALGFNMACTKPAAKKAKAPTSQPNAKKAQAPKTTRLVVYSGRSEGLVGSILKEFDAANPDIELDVRYNSTPTLANQVIAEDKQCPADVLWFQDSGYLSALGNRLDTLPASITSTVPTRFQAADQRWVGITGRLRVLVYNVDKIQITDLPQSLHELADPKWKGKIGWAPGNASMHAHVSALRHLWGEAKTKAWLEAMKANAPIRFPKNSPQVKAAHSGEISIGWVNHYYLHKLKVPGFKAANYSFPTTADAGNVLMLSGAAVRAGSKNKAAAQRLVQHLLTAPIQKHFAEKRFEYPVLASIAAHSDLTPLKDLGLAELDQKHLADVDASIAILNQLGIE